MSRRAASVLLIGCGAAATFLLQGCGEVHDAPKTVTPTTTSRSLTVTGTDTTHTSSGAPATTTTTSTTSGGKTRPMSAEDAAGFLNRQWLGFDEKDQHSFPGVVMSMAGQPDSFYKNIFCSTFDNPVKERSTCFHGSTDCRLSASLFNHKMIVSKATGAPKVNMGRPTGYIFNTAKVQNFYGKCSFMWDGATTSKFNLGCGDGAVGDCDSPHSAFGNICPSTGKVCTAEDKEVKSSFCKAFGGDHDYPPMHAGNYQCVFPGAAIDYHGQDDYSPGSDHLFDMAVQRVNYNGGTDPEGPNIEQWNEVILDERLLLPEIAKDPAGSIVAFVYVKAQMPISRQLAAAMRDEFCRVHKMEEKIPIVAIDDQAGASGPFSAIESEVSVV